MERTVEQIEKEIELQRDCHREAAENLQLQHEKLEHLIDERAAKIVEGFDPKLVQLARDYDLNPLNYESERELNQAIEHQKTHTKFNDEGEQ